MGPGFTHLISTCVNRHHISSDFVFKLNYYYSVILYQKNILFSLCKWLIISCCLTDTSAKTAHLLQYLNLPDFSVGQSGDWFIVLQTFLYVGCNEFLKNIKMNVENKITELHQWTYSENESSHLPGCLNAISMLFINHKYWCVGVHHTSSAPVLPFSKLNKVFFWILWSRFFF